MQALEVILEEYPAFVGPYSKTAAQCVECFRPWSSPKSGRERCAQCGLPVCGQECAKGRLHEVECAVMRRVGFRWAGRFRHLVWVWSKGWNNRIQHCKM